MDSAEKKTREQPRTKLKNADGTSYFLVAPDTHFTLEKLPQQKFITPF